MVGLPQSVQVLGRYDQLDVSYDPHQQTVWCHLRPEARPCFNPGLLGDIKTFQQAIRNLGSAGSNGTATLPVQFFVATSRIPGVFNLGGDLHLFLRCIRARDRQGLLAYATACIDVLHANHSGLGLPLTTISLVQGDALGGGFEAAISSHMVIAEKSARFGLPEVLFNLIPGMGAYSFLTRLVGRRRAERMILSAEIYTADQLHEIGVIDMVVPDGTGEQAVTDFIARCRRRSNAQAALAEARKCCETVSYRELLDITTVWADAALSLSDRDLRVMERLVGAQDRRLAGDGGAGTGEAGSENAGLN
jgi:DSF synthase